MNDQAPEVRLDTGLETLLERAPSNVDAVLATVVSTAGSTYRKPGARMLILADGVYLGLLSGGCLETDLQLHAAEVMRSGIPRAVEYDMRGPGDLLFGIGAGCEGAMRVLLEPAGPGSSAAAALAGAVRRTRAGVATSLLAVHDSNDLRLGTHSADAVGSETLRDAARRAVAEQASEHVHLDADGRRTRAFVQFLAPPPHLLICGAGPDARPVAATAVGLGWRVSVVDHRPAYALADQFPGAAVYRIEPRTLRAQPAFALCHAAVVMSHHLPSDVAYLRELAEAGAPAYVGLLGPAARRERIRQELGAAAAQLRYRLRGPVGMDIGAVTPEGIALAIVAEIHAWLSGPTASSPLPSEGNEA